MSFWQKKTLTNQFLARRDVDVSFSRDVPCVEETPGCHACAAPQGGCAVDAHSRVGRCQCLIFCAGRVSNPELLC